MDDWKTRILQFTGVHAFLTEVGVIIGISSKDELGIFISKPMEFVQSSDGQRGMRGVQGDPEKVYLSKEPLMIWDIKKKEVLATYVKHNSGIVIAGAVPSGMMKQ
jgi:hypothetical protein